MMRENVVHAATVNVDLIAEQRGGHCAAFDVPARAAATPRTFPADVAIFFIPRFPKREIANVLFVVFVVLYAAGRLQLREIEMRELPVIGKRSEEHTSELQSQSNLVCRLLLAKTD